VRCKLREEARNDAREDITAAACCERCIAVIAAKCMETVACDRARTFERDHCTKARRKRNCGMRTRGAFDTIDVEFESLCERAGFSGMRREDDDTAKIARRILM
jgi:hypothetical protein